MNGETNVAPPALWAGAGGLARARARLGRNILGLALVLVVAVLLWLPRLRGPIDLRYDAGVYYVLGTSLWEGKGYRLLNEPGQPEAIQYPPLLPLFVAAHQWVLGTSEPPVVAKWLRRSYFLLFVGYGVVIYAFARGHLGPILSAIASAGSLLQANSVLMSDLLFTELPFAAASVAFALLLWRSQRAPTLALETATGALAAAGFLLRSAGIALLAAWVLEAGMRRRWKRCAVRALVALIPFALWQVHVWRVQQTEDFRNPAYAYQRAPYQFYNVTYAANVALVDPFRPELGTVTPRDLLRRATENLRVIPFAAAEALSATVGFWNWGWRELQTLVLGRVVFPPGAVIPVLLLLSAAVAIGVILLLRRGDLGSGLFVLGSVALVCATPWPGQFARYLSPLVAFFWVAALLTVRLLWVYRSRWFAARIGLFATLAVLGLAASAQLFAVNRIFERRHADPPMPVPRGMVGHPVFYHDATWARWEAAVGWIAKNAPEDAVVATTSPHLCYLMTGRHAIFPPMEASPSKSSELLSGVPARYVIVDELVFLDISRVYAGPAMEGHPETWRLVWSEGQTRIYERRT